MKEKIHLYLFLSIKIEILNTKIYSLIISSRYNPIWIFGYYYIFSKFSIFFSLFIIPVIKSIELLLSIDYIFIIFSIEKNNRII